MMGTAALDKIHEDLEFLKKEVLEIKEHMIDRDAILTADEKLLLEKARKEHKEGRTTPLGKLEKELGG